MEFTSRSFRVERSSSSLRFERSNRSILMSELELTDFARTTGYERLSEWMRLGDKPAAVQRKSRAREALLGLVSFLRRRGYRDDCEAREEINAEEYEKRKKNKEKKRSSWLPDPDRRWPVQGW